MNILVINAGSSSLKYQLIDTETEEVKAKGIVERIGIPDSILKHQPESRERVEIKQDMENHIDAIKLVLEALTDKNHGVVQDMSEIHAVGHRVVHGGEKFSSSIVIDDEVMKAIEENIDLAPLHNPANIMGIQACKKVMPDVPMVAVFDTAFHQTMPQKAFLYALPYDAYKRLRIRRYGFHGTSHKYVSQRAAKYLKRPIEELKIVTCHLGNGASVAAVKYGKSVDTSMGFTPLEGLVMGTRCGDIDPSIVKYLMENENMTIEEVNDYLNKKSGVWGLSGVSSDFRDLEAAANEGNELALTTMELFSYRVKKYIGAYVAAMGGIDCLVFTAGIGENTQIIREMICKDMEFFGITLDLEKNKVRSKEEEISTSESTTKVLVIPTNEELMIARDTLELVGNC